MSKLIQLIREARADLRDYITVYRNPVCVIDHSRHTWSCIEVDYAYAPRAWDHV